ncbi:hypothetical protein KUTeg_007182 [Tegillarca granosa]|uniref:Trafficking protein particle complex subunit 10 n=1 Tax=Tegillarca granosa TaxID=220873 RepID=A0ABQ9FEV5_TEGGR|nr:hypothetical protein KUTeg_007182 [Tegillarca granosa]
MFELKDLDAYKQTVKDEISEWNNALKARNIPDWLIVVVISDESKVKTKLLPRSSVIDKVKNDFCNKLPDRCIVLTEPLKQDQKSSESWKALVHRLRELLLQAFNKHLNKYEENMRSLRESRNEPNWNFVTYFLVQEELAFMFEMIGLYDDAMIQYDELDALFTQFIVTHTSGKPVSWLVNMIKDCQSWAGLSLKKPINRDKQSFVAGIEQEASLEVNLGSIILKKDVTLDLKTSAGLSVTTTTGDGSIMLTQSDDSECHIFTVKVFQDVTDKDITESSTVSCDIDVSYLWEVKCNTTIPSLDLKFTCMYQCDHDNRKREMMYHCTVPQFETQYYVNVDVTPKPENKNCIVGYLSDLSIEFRQIQNNSATQNGDQQLLYEIQADGAMWGLCGKTVGIMNLEESKHQVKLEAIPLSAGYLLLPAVKLYKSVKAVWQKQDEPETEETIEEILDEKVSQKPSQQREPFNKGEVYYGSIGKQVHVYPENVSDHIEITMDSIGQTLQ